MSTQLILNFKLLKLSYIYYIILDNNKLWLLKIIKILQICFISCFKQLKKNTVEYLFIMDFMAGVIGPVTC